MYPENTDWFWYVLFFCRVRKYNMNSKANPATPTIATPMPIPTLTASEMPLSWVACSILVVGIIGPETVAAIGVEVVVTDTFAGVVR
jgi:hypothetical protein